MGIESDVLTLASAYYELGLSSINCHLFNTTANFVRSLSLYTKGKSLRAGLLGERKLDDRVGRRPCGISGFQNE